MRIIDCFPFFNEIELLLLRLRELDPYVDFFVIVEGDRTQKGTLKPFLFKKIIPFIKKYIHKIVYYQLNCPPFDIKKNRWEIELLHRKAMDFVLGDLARPNDIILHGDIDEIPNTDILTQVIGLSKKDNVIFSMDLFYYYMNTRRKKCQWNGTIMSRYGNFISSPNLRLISRNGASSLIVKKSGWHYSSLGDYSFLQFKMSEIADSDVIPALPKSSMEFMEYISNLKLVWELPEDEQYLEIINLREEPHPKNLYWLINEYPYLLKT